MNILTVMALMGFAFYIGIIVGQKDGLKKCQNQLRSCQDWRGHNEKSEKKVTRHVHVID